jgi:hypothetical protein
MRLWAWLTFAIVLSASPAAAKCHFDYSPEIERAVVEPAFATAFGEHRLGYDPHKPVIKVKGRTVPRPSLMHQKPGRSDK